MHILTCTNCKWQSPDDDLNACPQCGATIDIIYSSPEIPIRPDLPGIWRYSSRLPLCNLANVVSLGEGSTPLIQSAWLGRDMGLPDLHFKVEGANPTGSYKDRIASVGIARLVELGKGHWAATSSGNAGASFAAYGVRAGLTGHLFTLEKPSGAKITQIMAYGPKIYTVARLGYDPLVEQTTWQNIQIICNKNKWGMLVTARRYSPHAMEGIKTMSFEICEQLRTVPDVVYVPVGGGGMLSALWKGFLEWKAAGYTALLPKMVSVSPTNCDAVGIAWRLGRPVEPISNCGSTISGLQLTAPPDGNLVLRTLRESEGWHTAIPDDATYGAQAELANREGLYVEPAAAIALAAVQADIASGRLSGTEKIACILTGIGFKDATAALQMAAAHSMHPIQAEAIINVQDNNA